MKNDIDRDGIRAKFLEVSIKEVNGDQGKLIKKFLKKCRKEEVIKPYFDKLRYFETKSQKRRRQKQKSIFKIKKSEF